MTAGPSCRSSTAKRARRPVPPLALDLANQVLDFPVPPRHPLRRHGAGRSSADRVLPGGVGADGEPLGAPVGQGRLRVGRPREVRPAGPRDAHDAAPGRRPRARARRHRDRYRHHPAGARGLHAAVRGRHHRRVPGGEPRLDMATLPRLCAPSASTTSWWRSRGSVRGPSRVGRCIPTCGDATARSR